jgi:hypothetical protein
MSKSNYFQLKLFKFKNLYREKRSSYIDKRINSTRRYDNYKHRFIQQIHKIRSKERDRLQYNNEELQHPTCLNGQIIQAENQPRNISVELYTRPSEPDRYLQQNTNSHQYMEHLQG